MSSPTSKLINLTIVTMMKWSGASSLVLVCVSLVNCIHIEHLDPYESVEKYYQYGYQVDDHYTGGALLKVLNSILLLVENKICFVLSNYLTL